jgi:adenylate cyclase
VTLCVRFAVIPPARSPEIESVTRRVLLAFETGDMAAMANLVSADPSLRVLGFAVDEWWAGPEEFLTIRETQIAEIPALHIQVERVDAFEDGAFGWAAIATTVITSETKTPMKHTAVLRLEAGAWKVILWTNSVPVPNSQIFGVELTTTLDHLVTSVLDEHSSSSNALEGTMTLVFTDIVDSTGLAEALGDTAWAELISRHESIIRQATASQGGTVVKLLGDGSMLAFESARAAVRAAIEIQRGLGSRVVRGSNRRPHRRGDPHRGRSARPDRQQGGPGGCSRRFREHHDLVDHEGPGRPARWDPDRRADRRGAQRALGHASNRPNRMGVILSGRFRLDRRERRLWYELEQVGVQLVVQGIGK